MSEDKAGKATALPGEIHFQCGTGEMGTLYWTPCPGCGANHLLEDVCPNAGKKFKKPKFPRHRAGRKKP